MDLGIKNSPPFFILGLFDTLFHCLDIVIFPFPHSYLPLELVYSLVSI
jgi:hypothetical protein